VTLQDVAQLIARLLLSWLFLQAGYGHLTQVKPMAGYAKAVGKIPMAEAAVIVSGLMLLAGGLSILLGYHPRIGAALLFVFLVPVAFTMHAYWRETDPMQRAGQRAHFWKNMALAGAALWIVANPGWPWPWSIG
jgi:putative oxidoreductase